MTAPKHGCHAWEAAPNGIPAAHVRHDVGVVSGGGSRGGRACG